MFPKFLQTLDLEIPPQFCVCHKMHLNLELNEEDSKLAI